MSAAIPLISPWRRVPLDPLDGGSWIVAGDVDGDGEVEIVTARNIDVNDVHYTCTMAAYKLDGTRLWRWGGPGAGRAQLHHDVACQLYDWDGDGRLEVIVCDERELVELDGATGREKRRLPLPWGASDCLTFCNLSGGSRATDVLVKNRYADIWAFDRDWRLLWTRQKPGGHLTAHQPLPLDIDCGAHLLAMIDGTGKLLWACTGEHFESIDVGQLRPDVPGHHLLVDMDRAGWGNTVLQVISEDGALLNEMTLNDTRHHRLLDWRGTGVEDIVVGVDHALFDAQGRRSATLAIDPYDRPLVVHIGNLAGNGLSDILLGTRYGTAAYLYRNEHGKPVVPALPLGTGMNVTLY